MSQSQTLRKSTINIPNNADIRIKFIGNTEGYDGHSLRAYAYFTDQMQDIDPTSVKSINSIKTKYSKLRSKSKGPTFACTYDGTINTLVKNCGFGLKQATEIFNSYQELYKESVNWVKDKLEKASETGYVTCAFGLRLRTNLLKQVILGNKSTPYHATKEGRTAGNALGQSWGLLNNRAASEFMQKVRNSKFKNDILPCAHIHDSQYFRIRANIETILFLNTHLVKAIEYQDHPDIYHDTIKLSGEVSIHYPNGAYELVIPNNITKDELTKLCKDYKDKLNADKPI